MNISLTAVGANLHSGSPEQELCAVDTRVKHHAPADVGVHGALLAAPVYKLHAQLKVVPHADLQCGQHHLHVSHRENALLSFAAELLGFLQDSPLLCAAWTTRLILMSFTDVFFLVY